MGQEGVGGVEEGIGGYRRGRGWDRRVQVGEEVVGAYINTNYDGIQKNYFIYINCFPFTLNPFSIYIHIIFCHQTTGVILLKEGGVKGDDYGYDFFYNRLCSLY